jgi:hypothetical protein
MRPSVISQALRIQRRGIVDDAQKMVLHSKTGYGEIYGIENKNVPEGNEQNYISEGRAYDAEGGNIQVTSILEETDDHMNQRNQGDKNAQDFADGGEGVPDVPAGDATDVGKSNKMV